MGQKKVINESFETSQGKDYPFIALYHDMLDSAAWKELTAHDIMLYLYMRRKHLRKVYKKRIVKSNKNDISIPRAEYRKFMHQSTFEKSIDHLIDLGFVKLVENHYEERKCNIYAFSDMWQYYRTSNFKVKPECRRTLKQRLQAENQRA